MEKFRGDYSVSDNKDKRLGMTGSLAAVVVLGLLTACGDHTTSVPTVTPDSKGQLSPTPTYAETIIQPVTEQPSIQYKSSDFEQAVLQQPVVSLIESGKIYQMTSNTYELFELGTDNAADFRIRFTASTKPNSYSYDGEGYGGLILTTEPIQDTNHPDAIFITSNDTAAWSISKQRFNTNEYGYDIAKKPNGKAEFFKSIPTFNPTTDDDTLDISIFNNRMLTIQSLSRLNLNKPDLTKNQNIITLQMNSHDRFYCYATATFGMQTTFNQLDIFGDKSQVHVTKASVLR